MFSNVKDTVFSTGYITVVLYILAATFIFLGMFYPSFFFAGFALGILLFIISSVIVGFLVKRRLKT